MREVCVMDDCGNPRKTRTGYCGKHWERIKRHGDPTTEILIWGDPVRRFWSRVDKTETCWLWTGALDRDGYGELFSIPGRGRVRPHRLSYEWARGEIPPGMVTDHLCRVRNCVNPDHLEIVTPSENTRRANKLRYA